MAWSHPTIEDYLLDFRSKGDLHRKVHHVPHPAAQLLHEFYTKGATIKLSNPPWTEEHKRQVLKRGPHKISIRTQRLPSARVCMLQKMFLNCTTCKLDRFYACVGAYRRGLVTPSYLNRNLHWPNPLSNLAILNFWSCPTAAFGGI
jgi:hypothetical protein